MLLIRLINLSSKLLVILSFVFLFESKIARAESVDIWKKEKNEIKEEKAKQKNDKEKTTIDFSKEDKNLGTIKITDDKNNVDNETELVGLYDPGKNDLSLTMWSNTDGTLIKDTLKRLTKIQLSDFSKKLFIDTMFTYSFAPEKIMS